MLICVCLRILASSRIPRYDIGRQTPHFGGGSVTPVDDDTRRRRSSPAHHRPLLPCVGFIVAVHLRQLLLACEPRELLLLAGRHGNAEGNCSSKMIKLNPFVLSPLSV
jgi:hypothetical protein